MSFVNRLAGMLALPVLLSATWNCAAADLQPQPEPIPDQVSSVNEQSVGYAAASDDEECAEFCGLPVCSPPGRFWLRADYLMWWTSGQNLPPLVTTSPQGTAQEQAGVLPNASILYGDETINYDGRSGVRTALGAWLDACHIWGVEFDFLNLGQPSDCFSRTSTGNPILARPYFNVETNQQDRELVAFPDIVEGTVSVDARDYFQSIGATLSYNLCSSNCCDSCDPCEDACGPPLLYCCRSDLLFGFRHYNLNDSIGIAENLRITDPGPTQDNTFAIRDNFHAGNEFYGGELGLRNRLYRGRWSLDILTKVAVGGTRQTVNIDGSTTVTASGQPTQVYDAGVFAVGSNSGTYQRDVFAMIPQLGVELGCQLTCHWRAMVGYNILYWGCVTRAADQIDLNLDPRNIPPVDPDRPGLPFPAFAGRTSCFWAQGVNVGAEYRF
jgi:hypothetical protein